MGWGIEPAHPLDPYWDLISILKIDVAACGKKNRDPCAVGGQASLSISRDLHVTSRRGSAKRLLFDQVLGLWTGIDFTGEMPWNSWR